MNSMNSKTSDTVPDAGPISRQETEEELGSIILQDDTPLELGQFSQKLTELPNRCEDPEEYPRNGEETGALVIFNNKYFSSSTLRDRDGSEKDVIALVDAFGKIGFNINPNYICNDFSRTEIIQKIREIAKDEALENGNCLVVAFLSHGDSGDTLKTKRGDLTVSELVEDFANSEYLSGKPKLFLIQACKGEGVTDNAKPEDAADVATIPTSQIPSLVTTYTFTGPQHRDIIKVYSTVEGKISYRHCVEGSWFIQEFCKNLANFGRLEDVISLVTRTTRSLANFYYHIFDEKRHPEIHKQMPMFVSTLEKDFYLTRSYQRNFLLEHRKKLENAAEKIVNKRNN